MNTQRGLATSAIIGIIALLVIGGGAWFVVQSNQATTEGDAMMQKDGDAMMEKDDAMMKAEGDVMIKSDDAMMKADGDAMMHGDSMMQKDESTDSGDAMMKSDTGAMTQPTYQGTRLAGSADAPLLAFNQADYEAAQKAGKTVLLWYYSDWCPTCKAEQAQISAAFDAFTGTGVVGFRVNINDNNTDEHEVATAREFGVAFRHTKVALKNGERILKTTETWNKDNYLAQLNAWASVN